VGPMPYGITWLLMPPWLERPRHAYSLPRGDLIRHAALTANLPRFACLYSFMTRFLGQILKAFWCSKWVIWDIVGKLEKSTFQRYKFCMNWSSDGKVMAPGSRVSELFFSRFSGKDSGQTGEATDEPRVASRIRSCSLSYAPELADQIAASWKESAREGGCPGEKTCQIFGVFSLFLSAFACMVDVAPNVGFRHSWCLRKACATLFLKVPDLQEIELWLERYGPANRGHQRVIFQSRFRLDRGKSWRSESFTSCLNVSSFLKLWTFRSHCSESKRICVRTRHPWGEKFEIFSIVLFLPSVLARMVDVAPDVGFRRSWCRRKACATFFLKVLGLYRGELGFARYDLANRGC
jgi:hypothetical protein